VIATSARASRVYDRYGGQGAFSTLPAQLAGISSIGPSSQKPLDVRTHFLQKTIPTKTLCMGRNLLRINFEFGKACYG
jgi:hypothetical protein